MTTKPKHEALRLADALDNNTVRFAYETEDQAAMRRIKNCREAAAMLRRVPELERDAALWRYWVSQSPTYVVDNWTAQAMKAQP